MDNKTLKKICKIVLKKDKKKKGKKKKGVTRFPFEDPTTRGAFPIAGRAGFGTYGQPFGFGYAPPAGGTTIVARDQPLEVIKKPPVKLVGGLEPEEERKFKEGSIDITKQEQAFKLLNEARNKQMEDIRKEEQERLQREQPFRQPRVLKPDEFDVESLSSGSMKREEFEPFVEDPDTGIFYTPVYGDMEQASGVVELVELPEAFQRPTEADRIRRQEAMEEEEMLRNINLVRPEQPTEILQPQLDFSLIRERARERKERSQMADEDVNKAIRYRKKEDIPSRLREVAERSRMRREDVNVNPTILEEVEVEPLVYNRPRTYGIDASEVGESITDIDNPFLGL